MENDSAILFLHQARYTAPTSRGTTFAVLLISQSVGRVAAPTIAACLAEIDITVWPWVYLAVCNLFSMVLVFFARKIQPKHLDPERNPLLAQRLLAEQMDEADLSPPASGIPARWVLQCLKMCIISGNCSS